MFVCRETGVGDNQHKSSLGWLRGNFRFEDSSKEMQLLVRNFCYWKLRKIFKILNKKYCWSKHWRRLTSWWVGGNQCRSLARLNLARVSLVTRVTSLRHKQSNIIIIIVFLEKKKSEKKNPGNLQAPTFKWKIMGDHIREEDVADRELTDPQFFCGTASLGCPRSTSCHVFVRKCGKVKDKSGTSGAPT